MVTSGSDEALAPVSMRSSLRL